MPVIDVAQVKIIPDVTGFTRQLKGELDTSIRSVTGAVDKSVKGATGSVSTATTTMASRVKGSLGTIKGAFLGAFAGTAVLGGLRGVISGIRGAITAASDLGETTSKAAQIFGQDALPALQKFAGGAAKALGQSKQEALDAAATFGVFGKSAGLTGQNLVGFSTELTGLASDLASFGNTTPQEAIDALGSALRGESEPIRKYGVLLDEATLRQRAMTLGIVDNVKTALTPQQKVLAAQAEILAQTGDAQGDFARTSGGLANQQRILSAQFQNMKTTLGRAFLPVVTAVVTAMNAMFSVFGKIGSVLAPVGGFIQQNATAFKAIAAVIGAALIPALIRSGVQATIWAARQVAAGAAAVVSYARAGIAATASAVKQVAAWVLVGTQSLIQAGRVAAAWLIAMGPIGWAIAAVAVLVVVVIKNWDTIKNVIAAGWRFVQRLTSVTWAAIKAVVTGAINLVRNVIVGGFKLYLSFIRAQWNTVRAVTQAVWNAIKAVVSGAINTVLGVVRRVGQVVGVIRNAFNSARSAAASAINALIGVVRSIPGRAVQALGNVGRLLYNAGRNLIRGLIDGVKSMIGNLVSTVSGAVNKVRNLLPFSPAKEGPLSGSGDPKRAGRKIIEMITEGIRARIPGLLAAMRQVTAEISIPQLARPLTAGAPGGLGARGPGTALPPNRLSSSAPQIEVRVFIGEQELTGMVQTVLRSNNRATRRRAQAGSTR